MPYQPTPIAIRRSARLFTACMQIAAAWYEEQLREHPERQYAIDELAQARIDA